MVGLSAVVTVVLIWSVNFDLMFSHVSRLTFELIRCEGDKTPPLILDSHDGPGWAPALISDYNIFVFLQ